MKFHKLNPYAKSPSKWQRLRHELTQINGDAWMVIIFALILAVMATYGFATLGPVTVYR